MGSTWLLAYLLLLLRLTGTLDSQFPTGALRKRQSRGEFLTLGCLALHGRACRVVMHIGDFYREPCLVRLGIHSLHACLSPSVLSLPC